MIEGTYKKPCEGFMVALYVAAIGMPFLFMGLVVMLLDDVSKSGVDVSDRLLNSYIGVCSVLVMGLSVWALASYPGLSVVLALWSGILSIMFMNGIVGQREERLKAIADEIRGA